ncbi:MAG: ankyrin repeat domain-containing protein, partial [Myxococcales bacterium]|nr:ankyrin repeat domain-containing protein [Myxococcales bacterium]
VFPRNLRTLAGLGRLDDVCALLVGADRGKLARGAAPDKRWRGAGEWPSTAQPAVIVADAFRHAVACGQRGSAEALLAAALEIEEGALEALVARAGGSSALCDFLLARRHVLHIWGEQALAPWLQEILAEADGRNVVDDALLKRAAEAARAKGHVAINERILAAVPRRLRAARTRPFNDARAERFLFACQHGVVELVEELLASEPALAGARNKWGQGPLHLLAAYAPHGAAALARRLIGAGVAVDGGGMWTPLLTASLWADASLARVLIEAGATLEQPTSALWMAATASRFNSRVQGHDYLEIVGVLIDAGADVDACCDWGSTAWGNAAAVVRLRLERAGAAPRERVEGRERGCYSPSTGLSPLLEALAAGDEASAREMASQRGGGDLDEEAALGDEARVRWLLRERYDYTRCVHGHGDAGRALHFAAYFGQAAMVKLLLDVGYSMAAPNAPEPSGVSRGPKPTHGKTPLEIAAARGHAAVVDALLAHLDDEEA